MKVQINHSDDALYQVIVNNLIFTSVGTLILLLSTPERPPNPILKSSSPCSYKECYSQFSKTMQLPKFLRTLMTQVRARMRKEKLFSRINRNKKP